MRVGTWNLEGRWSDGHRALMADAACDLWLLTEVPLAFELEGLELHRTGALMAPTRHWAAIASTEPITPLPDPHPATAAAMVGDMYVMSTVLPWRSCGSDWPGEHLSEKQRLAIESLRPAVIARPTVWGGDWNQSFERREYVGTKVGRALLTELATTAGLKVTTSHLESASPGHASIDHIAVPTDWQVVSTTAVSAASEGRRLSDHDAYLIEVVAP